MDIREILIEDRRDIMVIVKKLNPDWFDDFAVSKSIPLDIFTHKGFVAIDKKKIVGFLTFTSDMGKVKISWMGVDLQWQRHGIGSLLVKKLQEKLNNMGIKELRVVTLSERITSKSYEKTRAFYKKLGFTPEKTHKIISMVTGKKSELVTMLKYW
jgi:ribosomal protein S18 acetylase RimI-like enzyme